MFRRLALAASVATLALPTLAHSESHAEMDPNVSARMALMQLYAYNLGVLGGMAQGRMEYDADLAQSAATSLYHLSRSGSGRMWPEGTDNFAMDNTRALPAIWENMADFGARFGAMQEATAAMNDAAGNGLEALQAALGPVGMSCGGCHRTYRQSDD